MNFILSYIYSFLTDGILYIIILLPIYIICRYIFIKKKIEKNIRFQTSALYEIAAAGLFIYLIMLFTQTFIVNVGANAIELIPFRIIILQFRAIFNSRKGLSDFIFNVVGNIGVFVPIGFLLAYLYKSNIKKTILCGCIISVFIETVQLFLERTTDIDDVILNTIGTAVGFLIYKIIKKIQKKRTANQ